MRNSVCTPTAFSSVNTSVKKLGSALILNIEPLESEMRLRTVVLSNLLYLDGCCEGRQQILPLLQNTVQSARRSNVLSCQTQRYKSITQSYKVLYIIGLHLCRQHTDEIVKFVKFVEIIQIVKSDYLSVEINHSGL